MKKLFLGSLATKKVAIKFCKNQAIDVNNTRASGNMAGQRIHFHLHTVPQNKKNELIIKKNKALKK